jgi:tetratricopeptide (TPR) repeat protein
MRSHMPRIPVRHRTPRHRAPSTSGYMITAAAAAAALFFVLWWMLQSEEYPWVPAGLAASVVMLVAASAREIVMRRAWSRYILDRDRQEKSLRVMARRSSKAVDLRTPSHHAAALRALQKECALADAADALPEAHLDAYNLCKDYLATTDEVLLSPALNSEGRIALRGGQERVRALQKHHLLAWACNSSRVLTREAQQRSRLSEKIELANRARDCIDSALQVYPEEAELNESVRALDEFIASSRVAHWIELGERAAFKGYYKRAIDCYSDALFYLMREGAKDDSHTATADRISREIDLLRARMAAEKTDAELSAKTVSKRKMD